jgi:hypothetical protein
MSIDSGTLFPDSSTLADKPDPCLRVKGVSLFSLAELDPRQVVAGVRVAAGFVAADVMPVGQMRETCPYCTDVPLQLVLRANHVIRTHLFCEQCTRCFDAIDPDGHSALLHSRLPIVY